MSVEEAEHLPSILYVQIEGTAGSTHNVSVKYTQNGEEQLIQKSYKRLPAVVITPVGTLSLSEDSTITKGSRYAYSASVTNPSIVADWYKSRLSAAPTSEYTSIVRLVLNDTNIKRVETLCERGGVKESSVFDLACKSDVVITMVPSFSQAKEVYDQVFAAAKKGTICIDMSTIEPEKHVDLSKTAESFGLEMLDAPVVKSESAAKDGTLGIYVGGKREVFNEAKEILNCMGSNVIYLGEAGKGMLMKICHNMMGAEIQNGLNEMLCMAQKGGISITEAIEAAKIGGADNAYMNTKKTNLTERLYKPAFSVKNMHKDINIAKTIAVEKDLKLPCLDVCVGVYDETYKNNALDDFSVTFETIKKRNGI